MTPRVKVVGASKAYTLGAVRTSILQLLGGALRASARSRDRKSREAPFWALRDVTFDVADGQSLGLIGKNGAGKTTLLKLLAGITRPTRGTVQVRGRVSALIELGAGFHPDLSGRENVYLNGAILGLTRREVRRRFDEVVAFAELERFVDTPVKRYSSGMAVRLGFAVAACIEPEVLLVDEVLAVGDAAFRQKCLQRIHALLRGGTTIVFVSHNLYMVRAVCPTSLYIRRGELVHAGKTTEAIALYERDLHLERAEKSARAGAEAPAATEVQIRRVEVLDPVSRVPRPEYRSGEALEVRVQYACYRSNGEVNAVVSLVRTDGLTCCTMRSSMDDVCFPTAVGDGVISILLSPLQLAGGAFYVDAQITDASDAVLLSSGWSEWFHVSGAGPSHQYESGVFEPHHSWRRES